MQYWADNERGVPDGRAAGVEGMPFVAFALDAEGVFTASEGEGLASLGLEPGEVVGRSAYEVYREEAAVLHNLDRALSGESFSTVVEVGATAFRCRYDPLRGPGGVVVGLMGLAAETGELSRSAREALLKERAIVASSEGVVITDPNLGDNPIVYVNPAFEAITGYAAGEVLGRNCRFLRGEERDQPALEELQAALREERECSVLLRNYKKDGTLFWNELSVSPVLDEGGRILNFVGVQKDVTERVRREEDLKESEQRFRLLAEQSLEGIVLSEHGEVLDANRSFAEMFDYPLKDLVGREVADLVARDEREAVARRIFEEDVRPYEARGLRRDGSTFPMEVRPRRIPYRGRRVRVTSVVDLTDRKRAEASLRESEERFRRTFEAAAVGMAHVAPDGRWLRINGKLAEITGYTMEELLSLTFQDITHSDDLEKDLKQVNRMLVGEIENYSIEKRYVKKDGKRIWIGLAVSALRSPEGELTCFVTVVEDVTGRKLGELVPDPLTEREIEVLNLVARRRTNEEIARELSYSEGMIRHHVGNVRKKLGAGKRAKVAERAIEIGLIPPPR